MSLPASLPASCPASSPTLSRRRVLIGLTALAAVGLAACTSDAPPPRAFPELRFTTQPPLVFAAQGPVIDNQARLPGIDPHVEHLMPLPPHRAVEVWARDRLQTTGVGDHTLRVVIREASVTETPLEVQRGVRGFFTDQQEARYDARIDVAVRMIDAAGTVIAESNAVARRSRTLSQRASLAERERLWFELIERLMHDMDASLTPSLRNHLRSYMVGG